MNGAASTINELQVETYGSMDKKEKVTFILEQLRLTLADKDYDRAQIICKKIATKYFDNNTEEDVQKLKLKYFKLMIQLGLKEKKYLEVSKYFVQVYETPIVKEEPKHVRYISDQKLKHCVECFLELIKNKLEIKKTSKLHDAINVK